jgi:class 3 adenylate cyclase
MGAACALPRKSKEITNVGKPLHVRLIEAAANGNIEKLKALLQSGASVDSCDYAGRSALHLASSEGQCESIRCLIDHQANVSITDRWGNEPLHEAFLNGHTNAVRILSNAGAVLSPDWTSHMEIKFLHCAAKEDLHGVMSMIGLGIWIDATDALGRTALQISAERGNNKLVEYLISKSADINCRDDAGNTAMLLALQGGHADVRDRLLQSGASTRDWLATLKSKRQLMPDMAHFALLRSKRAMHASFAVMEAFPRPIATAMLEGRQAAPISRTVVTLLYSDICGFTTITSTMDPARVSAWLNRLFHKFDRLAHAHGVQKVDVVGDAYIAATNLLEEQPADHAARLARFALDMARAALDTPIDPAAPGPARAAPIRVGPHSGPVEARLASGGSRYTLVGGTAIVAARMESSSLPGRVQCSAACARLIAAQAHGVIVSHRQAALLLPVPPATRRHRILHLPFCPLCRPIISHYFVPQHRLLPLYTRPCRNTPDMTAPLYLPSFSRSRTPSRPRKPSHPPPLAGKPTRTPAAAATADVRRRQARTG